MQSLPILITLGALFVTICASITIFGYGRLVKSSSMLERLDRSTALVRTKTIESSMLAEDHGSSSGWLKCLASVGRLLPASAPEERMMRKEFVSAGVRNADAVAALTGAKLAACAVLGTTALLCRDLITDDPFRKLAIPAAAAIGGYIAPGFLLRRKIAKRQAKIRLALPDVLDMLVIATEAGSALDKSILSVSREFRTFHPEISEELALVNAEMLAGASRIDALRHFAERTGEEELSKLVAILVQTDRFGTSIAEALRSQSEFMRVQRKQVAEEKAGKVGVKLVFPIFFFCMPSLMVLVAGPGLISVLTNLPNLASQ